MDRIHLFVSLLSDSGPSIWMCASRNDNAPFQFACYLQMLALPISDRRVLSSIPSSDVQILLGRPLIAVPSYPLNGKMPRTSSLKSKWRDFFLQTTQDFCILRSKVEFKEKIQLQMLRIWRRDETNSGLIDFGSVTRRSFILSNLRSVQRRFLISDDFVFVRRLSIILTILGRWRG